MGINEYSQPASKSSWDSQDFGDVNMVLKMAHFHKSSRPQWVKGVDIGNLVLSGKDVRNYIIFMWWFKIKIFL